MSWIEDKEGIKNMFNNINDDEGNNNNRTTATTK